MILLLQLNGFSTVDGLVSPSKPRIFNTLQVIMLPEVVDHLGSHRLHTNPPLEYLGWP